MSKEHKLEDYLNNLSLQEKYDLYELLEEEFADRVVACDVEGCDFPTESGGVNWRDTGYWSVCIFHSREAREGKRQPQMKERAIKREKSRDPITGWLPSNPQ